MRHDFSNCDQLIVLWLSTVPVEITNTLENNLSKRTLFGFSVATVVPVRLG